MPDTVGQKLQLMPTLAINFHAINNGHWLSQVTEKRCSIGNGNRGNQNASYITSTMVIRPQVSPTNEGHHPAQCLGLMVQCCLPQQILFPPLEFRSLGPAMAQTLVRDSKWRTQDTRKRRKKCRLQRCIILHRKLDRLLIYLGNTLDPLLSLCSGYGHYQRLAHIPIQTS